MSNLVNLFTTVQNILNSLIPVIVALGLVYFIWGIVVYVIADEEEAKKNGRNRIIYGIIAFVIIIGFWGVVTFIGTTFGISGTPAPVATSGYGCDTSGGLLDFSKAANGEGLQHIAGYITCTIRNAIIPFMFALALLVFIWGVVKYFIVNADEEAKRSQGKQFMIWGLIALTVMLCMWGLVHIFAGTLGIDTLKVPLTPTK